MSSLKIKNTIKHVFVVLTLIVFNFFVQANIASACTEMMLNYKNQYVVGRNFDWPVSFKRAFLVINPVGIQRQSNDMNIHDKQLAWTSKYGSITVDLGKSDQVVLPKAVMSGMNQYGLTASVLWLQESMYPNVTNEPALTTGLWVQYFLDNAKTVKEAIQLSSNIKIEPTIFSGRKILLHLIMQDATGDTAVLDYINGKLRISHGGNLPISALTNNSYSESIQFLKQYQNFGGQLPLPGGYGSKERFVRAACFIKRLSPLTSIQQSIAYVFAGLGDTAAAPGTETPTIWSAVFDLSNKILYYRDIDNPNIRFVKLSDFNLANNESVKVLPLNNTLTGNLSTYFRTANFQHNGGYLILNNR